MSKLNTEKRASLVSDLMSENETIALAAIEKVKKSGDASLVPAILNALANTKELAIENALSQLLFDLKDKNAVEELVNQLSNPEFATVRVLMLSACWQTGIDLSHRLPDFVTVACTGNYVECLEVLTVIENWEAIKDQEMLENETIRLRSYLSESDTPENDEMIFSILEVMEGFVSQ
ncbi:MAG: hypothetical protein GC178_02495 [Flavobacteriales bacterium]|nr:hypothetical protein [Flavobacteriales bacterium]